jgi:hypothetical protein
MNYINKRELQKIIDGAPKGASKAMITSGLAQRGYTIQGVNDQEKKSFVGGLIKEIASPFVRGGQALKTGMPVLGATLQGLPAAIGLGDKEKAKQRIMDKASVAQEGMKKTIDTPLGSYNPITNPREALGAGLEAASWFVGGGGVAQAGKLAIRARLGKSMVAGAKSGAVGGGLYGAGSALSRDESVGQAVTSGTIGGALGGAGGAVLGGAMAGAGIGARALTRKITGKLQPVAEQTKQKVVDYIAKSIKPRMTNLNVNQLKKVQDKQVQAFQVLANNKNAIKITDEAGFRINRLPKTVKEVSEAITDVKTKLFNQYDKLARNAGEAGANFSPTKTLSSLRKLADDKSYSPSLRKYINEIADEVLELKGENPLVVQSRIKELNESLAGYFAGRVEKGRARIDASVAKLLNEELDDVIFNFTGGQWKRLRSDFSALKTIEKDVNKQALLMMRKSQKGMMDLTDIFTGGDLVSGIMTLNPASVARGLFGRGIKEYYKMLNNPDRYIRKIFEELGEKAPSKINLQSIKTLPRAIKEGVGDALKKRPGLTIEDVSPKGKGEILRTTPLKSEVKTFKRDLTLTGEDKIVQEKSIKKFVANKQKLVNDYIRDNGLVANTDNARKLFSDVGYTGGNSAAVHEASSALNKLVWKKVLRTAKNIEAILFSGGSGSGKSSVAEQFVRGLKKGNSAVLDSNLSGYNSAVNSIGEALKAKKVPRITYIYREPVDAFIGTIKRMLTNPKEGGRLVPIKVTAGNHPDSLGVVKKIYEEYGELIAKKKLKFTFIDNSMGAKNAVKMNYDKVKKIKIPPDIESKMRKALDKIYKDGIIIKGKKYKITQEQYNQLIK